MNSNYVYIYLDPHIVGNFEYGSYKFSYEPFYIGCGKNNRLNDHLKEAIYNEVPKYTNRHKFYRIKKILSSGCNPIIFKIIENLTPQAAMELEIFLIKLIGRKDKNTGPLLNLTDGGENGPMLVGEKNAMFSLRGKNHPASKWQRTEEYWKHVSESLMGSKNHMYGRKWTDEQKGIHSEKVKNFWKSLTESEYKRLYESIWTEERRKNTSNFMKGRFSGKNHPFYGTHRSEETKRKIAEKASIRNKGKGNPKAKKWQVISPTDELFIVDGELHKFCKDKNIGCADALKLAGREGRRVSRGPGKGWFATEIKSQS